MPTPRSSLPRSDRRSGRGPENPETDIADAETTVAQSPARGRPARTSGPAVPWLQIASYLSILLAWIVASALMPEALFPGPIATLEFIGREIERGTLFMHLWATARRVIVAFALGMTVGVITGAAMGMSRRIDRILEGWLIAGLTIPRIILFVMAYLLLGLSDSAAIAALVVTVIPGIVVQIREGTRALDRGLIEMAQAYRRSQISIWRSVILPQLMPYVIGTARASLSLAWKMVVLAELLGRTSGVGYQIAFYFQMFNMIGILAYGVTMMVLLAIIDLGLLGALQRRAFRWRAPAKAS